LTHPGTFFIRGGDMVMNGGNNWVFHTPDDNRRTMYITPSGTYNQENWNWGAATEMNEAGNIKPGNDIVMRAGKTIFGDGRVHMSGPELIYFT
jgi:hypothetical protein